MPRPRKLSAPSITMTMPIPSIANVISWGAMLGARCRNTIRQVEVPDSFAAAMKGCSRSRSTAARETRANAGTQKNASVRMVFRSAGPERQRDRQDERQRREGDEHVKQPHDDGVEDAAGLARREPPAPRRRRDPSRFTVSATMSEVRPPYRSRARMSLPLGSVPRMCPGENAGGETSSTSPPGRPRDRQRSAAGEAGKHHRSATIPAGRRSAAPAARPGTARVRSRRR